MKFSEWISEKYQNNLMAWFGNSKVKTSDGKPLVVYHGTSDVIQEFDPKASEGLGSFARKGIFFTDNKESAGSYALQRQNLKFKKIIAAFNKAKEDYEELLFKLATKSKSHPPKSYSGETIPRMTLSWINDLHSDGKISSEDYQEYEKLEKILIDAEEEYELHNQTRWENAKPNTMPVYLKIERPLIIQARGMPWDAVVPANLAKFNPKENDGIIFKDIVDNADESEARSTVYVVFNPRQIKSAIGNNGNFDPNSNKITE